MLVDHHVCPKDWIGETVVIVASGPSTELVDLSLLKGKKVIAVAHGYRAVPDADVLLIGGHAFYLSNNLSDYKGPLIVAAQRLSRVTQPDPRLVFMYRQDKFGISDDPGALSGSESSVMLAINYAAHRGVSKVILLGCDGKPAESGRRRIGLAKKDTHDAIERYQEQERAMETQIQPLADRGIEIVNCSPGTALTIYPVESLSRAC